MEIIFLVALGWFLVVAVERRKCKKQGHLWRIKGSMAYCSRCKKKKRLSPKLMVKFMENIEDHEDVS